MKTAGTHRWYFVCSKCEAKVFAATALIACPRCSRVLESREMHQVPWLSDSARHSPQPQEVAKTRSSPDDSLLRTIAFALRHDPHRFFLSMDAEGWVNLDHLLLALRHERREWADIDLTSLRRVTQNNNGTRIEVQGNRIRALYGHSVCGVGDATPVLPPPLLYHGTCMGNVGEILRLDLQPMRRNHVHLTSDWNYANEVAATKSRPVVLSVRAQVAADTGVRFWKTNEHVWLSDAIPAQFVTLANRTRALGKVPSGTSIREERTNDPKVS